MKLQTTKLESANQVAIITLSRPQRHNAWTGLMHTEVRHCLDNADFSYFLGLQTMTIAAINGGVAGVGLAL